MKKKVRFITSAAKFEQCPPGELPEIAFIGRSNAGKSSLINAIFGTKIAKVSATPGKTTLLNFFEVGDKYRFVDTPGYGYAARSSRDVASWQTMIESYFSCRANLAGAVLVMDVRRKWQVEEKQLSAWLESIQVPLAVVFSKVDKLNRRDRERKIKEFSGEGITGQLFYASIKDVRSLEKVDDFLTNGWGKTKIPISDKD